MDVTGSRVGNIAQVTAKAGWVLAQVSKVGFVWVRNHQGLAALGCPRASMLQTSLGPGMELELPGRKT